MDRLPQLLCAVVPVRVTSLRVGLRTERGRSIFITIVGGARPGCEILSGPHTWRPLGAWGAGEIAGSVSASEARGPTFAR